MTLLPVEMDSIAHLDDRIGGEFLIPDLGFLQPDDVGPVLVDDRLQLVETGSEAVAIEGDDFHRAIPGSAGRRRAEKRVIEKC
jgi:hypothetical protein